MNAKGISYVVTKANMTAAFGEERWTAFMAKLAEKDNISALYYVHYSHSGRKLIVLFDEMCKEFQRRQNAVYKFGKGGAKVSCHRMVHTSHLC